MSQDSPAAEVDPREDLYRCLTTPAWWVDAERRPSSAAFKQPSFSADVASLAGKPEHTLARFPPGSSLVSFNYGDARAIGFVARRELDPAFPENKAHANVYGPSSGSKRKAMAQRLAQMCIVVREPTFGTSALSSTNGPA